MTSTSTPAPSADSVAATTEPARAEEPSLIDLTDFDFSNAEFVFRPGGNSAETVQVALVDGEAEVDFQRYTLGEVIHADVNGDGVTDAAAQLTMLDGNAIDEQWYLWIATDSEPKQVTLPIARMAHCGTATHSVTAGPHGGIVVHETRRRIGEHSLPCSEIGTDERVRTVMAVEARNEGEWWPHQVEPFEGFGGLCPIAAEYEGYRYDGDLHAAPDAASPEVTGGEPAYIHLVEGWPVYGEDFGGWTLTGIKIGDQLGCAWLPQ